MNKSDRIYLAGHTGLVGSAILRLLTRKGYRNVVTRTHAELDLTRQDAVEEFVTAEKPAQVFLAAARVGGIGANSRFPAEFGYENLAISLNVIHAAWRSNVSLLLNLGSSCIYPKLAPQPLREEYVLTGPLEPTNEAYAIAKIAALKLCHYYNTQYGTRYLSLMPTNLYGPNENFDFETSHVLPALIRKLHLGKLLTEQDLPAIRRDLACWSGDCSWLSKAGETVLSKLASHGVHADKVELWGTGKPFREFLHVDDLAEACLFLLQNERWEKAGDLINVGTGKDITIRALADLISEIVGYRGSIVFDASKPDGTPRKLLDTTRINALGWTPTIKLDKGIESMYRWYVDQVATHSAENDHQLRTASCKNGLSSGSRR